MVGSNKIKHKLSARSSGGEKPDNTYRDLIKQAIINVLQFEKVDIPCAVNVLLTDDKGIRKYNKDFRGHDRATDVLSFPMQLFKKSGWNGCDDFEIDEDTGVLPLGDIIISTERIRKQAGEYKRTYEYETSLMIVHSVLHLLGYAHSEKSDEQLMHLREKKIMNEMGYLES